MFRLARCQILDPRTIGGMKPAEQLMKCTENLRRKLCRDLGLGVAAGLQQRRQALSSGKAALGARRSSSFAM